MKEFPNSYTYCLSLTPIGVWERVWRGVGSAERLPGDDGAFGIPARIEKCREGIFGGVFRGLSRKERVICGERE
jgi:hypothetical protein